MPAHVDVRHQMAKHTKPEFVEYHLKHFAPLPMPQFEALAAQLGRAAIAQSGPAALGGARGQELLMLLIQYQ